MMRNKFFTVLFAFSFLCGCGDRHKPNSGAPVAGISVRQAWGEKEFGKHWKHVKDWIETSKLISENIGEIQDVAPIGKPNEKFHSFGESWSDMHLEVVGSKGTGVLFLHSFSIGWNQGRTIVRFHEGTFETEQRKEIICKSGKGYLEEFNVDQTYRELLNYPADEDPDIFHQKWRLFEEVVTATFPSHQSPLAGQPPLQGLRIYREPLLRKRAELLAGWGNKKDAVLSYGDVAEYCLDMAERELWTNTPTPDRKLVAMNLNTALESLRAANELQPENKEILKMARRRITLHHQLKDGLQSSKWPNVFYEAASREVKSIAFLKRELGRFSVRDEPSHIKSLGVNKKLRYSTTVFLKLDGTRDKGTVSFRYCESDKLPPIDLFAENPRSPDYPLVFKSPKWKSESGERVKISAKTGEPL